MINEQQAVLEKLSELSADEAKAEIFKRVEEDSRFEAAKLAKKMEDEALETSDRKSKKMLSLATFTTPSSGRDRSHRQQYSR